MPRLIFKCPYIKGGTSAACSHLENYVQYMATRSGVDRIDPGRNGWPATINQKEMIEQILRDFPLSRGMFEYEDYRATPTRSNASEFITRALEDNYDRIAKMDNYLNYIATRPRAQRIGSHGLFTGEEDSLVLAQIAEAVSTHPGNVWLPIISLRREDAARLGYDKADEWKALLSKYAMEMARAMKIPWADFRWYAAFHDEGHHPHVHMVCYSVDQSKGFLTKQGITQIKSGLAKEIFRQELTELYQKQTQRRNELNVDAQTVLNEVITHLLIGHRYPAADAALESTDYLTRLDAYTFHEGFAHLLSYQATEIDCVDWHTPQLTEVAAASRAKLRLALTETDPDRQKQFLEEAVCGSYYEKFACMCGMLYLADRWETQGIDGLQSAFADYHGFAQRALSIRI